MHACRNSKQRERRPPAWPGRWPVTRSEVQQRSARGNQTARLIPRRTARERHQPPSTSVTPAVAPTMAYQLACRRVATHLRRSTAVMVALQPVPPALGNESSLQLIGILRTATTSHSGDGPPSHRPRRLGHAPELRQPRPRPVPKPGNCLHRHDPPALLAVGPNLAAQVAAIRRLACLPGPPG